MSKIWCEINKSNLINNVNVIKKHIGNKKIMAVLKANAYGIGAREVSSVIDDKIDMYAVSSIEDYEKIQTKKDILIMSPLCSIEDFKYAENKKNLVLSIDNENILKQLNNKSKYRVHICIDTTNHRIGIQTKNLKNLISKINTEFKNITIEGVYTHFHNTSNISETMEQIECFKNIVSLLGENEYMIHCIASSVASSKKLLESCNFSNTCRVGNLLYGFTGQNIGTKKVYQFYGKVIQRHSVAKGDFIGFGASYECADKDMTIGIIEVGNYHGLGCKRETKENPIKSAIKSVKYNYNGMNYITSNSNNKKINIIGKVNMNSLIIDITDNPNEEIVKIAMSPILADSSIEKRYTKK